MTGENQNLQLIHGDARHIPLPDDSVQCIVTSPPYWGLRKYAGEQELVWGGFPKIHPGSLAAIPCDHEWTATATATEKTGGLNGNPYEQNRFVTGLAASTCIRCGAWRGAYGLEPTIEMYVAHTLEILRECRRVLRPDGVLFWNIGDSYAACRGNTYGKPGRDNKNINAPTVIGHTKIVDGVKSKDLCLIPERIAIAAQADGWWVRSRILWCKPNPMPESVTDRPTDAAEHIWMFTKSERYFWDADAVREPAVQADRVRDDVVGGNRSSILQHSPGGRFTQGENAFGYTPKGTHSRGTGDGGPKARARAADGVHEGWAESTAEVLGYRNLRNVWMFATQPYSGAHFATFPEELPRRCILAATSARGACTQCGAPWERVTRDPVTSGKSWNGDAMKSQGVNRNENSDFAGSNFYENYAAGQTIGWRPTCLCPGQHGKTVPCVVLDPFGGSGTTGRVALELRRRAVLVDIAYDAEYRELAERRTSGVNVKLPFL